MATEDILINDGDSFVSLSALAAEQVDAKLPISSEDGTVVLSDSSGSFVVSTGAKEQLTVSDDAVSSSVAIKSPSISGPADNDASVTLGANFEVRTGTDTDPKLLIDGNGRFKVQNNGTTNFFVKSDGNVGVNTNGQTYRKVDVGGSLIQSGGRQSSGIVSSLKFDNDDTAAKPTVYGFESAVGTVADKAFYRVAHYAAVKADGDSAIENHIGFFAQVNGGENAFGFYQTGLNTLNYFEGGALLPAIKGLQASHVRIDLTQQATLTAGDGSEYVVTNAASICTKKYADDKIVVCTSAEYAAISPKLSGTLYCLTD